LTEPRNEGTAQGTAEESRAFVVGPAVLTAGAEQGPLAGKSLAVKDVFDVAGTATCAGNPDFGASAPVARRSAPAVEALVAAGATVIGKTVTDELAYSLAGTNVHYGTPANPAAPGRIPGGSSSGAAAAVAAGIADLGLGTDTGGSIRVPASYCGLYGWRPTHGRINAAGMVHLARSFATVGLLTRDARLLTAAARVLAGDDAPGTPEVDPAVFTAELLEVVEPPVREAVRGTMNRPVDALGVDAEELAWAFQTLQGREAWNEHGEWITGTRPVLGPGIAARFTAASEVRDEDVARAKEIRAEAARILGEATRGGRVLLGPSAAGAAPPLSGDSARAAATRRANLLLHSLAGLAGAPVVSVPLARVDGLPLGLVCIGARGSDLALLRWASRLKGE
jgi:amidase